MTVGNKFTHSGEPFQRLLLPNGLRILNKVENRRIRHKESAIDQSAISCGLLAETADQIAAAFVAAVELKRTEAPGGCNGRDRGFFPVLLMKRDQVRNIDRCKTVAIGETEGLIAIEIRPDCLQPAAGHRVSTRLDERDSPRLAPVLMDFH